MRLENTSAAKKPISPLTTCYACKGKGFHLQALNYAGLQCDEGEEPETEEISCDECAGSGKIVKKL